MPSKEWYVYLQGETFGPVPQEVVTVMLRQNRLHFSDFVWCEGLTKWARIGELHAFQALMPPYPSIDIPPMMGLLPAAASVSAAPPKATSDPVVASAPPPAPQLTLVRPVEPMMSDAAKLRRFARVPVTATVHVQGHGTFEAVDIGEGGIFLRSTSPLPFGMDVQFRVESPVFPKPLEMTGIVIRKGVSEDGQAGFAIEFTRVNPAYRRLLQGYVNTKLPLDAVAK